MITTQEKIWACHGSKSIFKYFNWSGYYDGATTYFAAKYTQWQIDPSGKLRTECILKATEVVI